MYACAADSGGDALAFEDVTGECADAYGGQVCTWARMQDGAAIEIGATIPLASIQNAPEMVEMAWPPAATPA